MRGDGTGDARASNLCAGARERPGCNYFFFILDVVVACAPVRAQQETQELQSRPTVRQLTGVARETSEERRTRRHISVARGGGGASAVAPPQSCDTDCDQRHEFAGGGAGAASESRIEASEGRRSTEPEAGKKPRAAEPRSATGPPGAFSGSRSAPSPSWLARNCSSLFTAPSLVACSSLLFRPLPRRSCSACARRGCSAPDRSPRGTPAPAPQPQGQRAAPPP